MHALARFTMRGPATAALVVAAAAVLALLFPPVLLLSGATLSLVTLRQGLQQGFTVLAIATAGGSLLSWLTIGSPLPLLSLGLVHWLPVLALATVWRTTISLAVTLRLMALLGGLGVIAVYAILGDPATWWLAIVDQILPQLDTGSPLSTPSAQEQLRAFFVAWAPLMPGQLVASLLLWVLASLLLGRWWQALLYNPGGFGDEFRQLRLGQTLALITMAVTLLAWLLPMVGIAVFLANLAVILGLIFLIQGIAIAHALVVKLGLSKGWLIAFYCLLLILLLRLVIVLSLIDTWLDFRARAKPLRRSN